MQEEQGLPLVRYFCWNVCKVVILDPWEDVDAIVIYEILFPEELLEWMNTDQMGL